MGGREEGRIGNGWEAGGNEIDAGGNEIDAGVDFNFNVSIHFNAELLFRFVAKQVSGL